MNNFNEQTNITFTNMNNNFTKLLKNLGWWEPVTINIHCPIKIENIRRSKSLNFLEDIR